MSPEQFSSLKIGDLVKHNLTEKPLVVQSVDHEHGTLVAVLPVTLAKAACSMWQQVDLVEVKDNASLSI